MQKTFVQLPSMHLAGIVMASNDGITKDVATAEVGSIIAAAHKNGWCERIWNRKSPGKTYVTHTTYQRGGKEEYRYFIGEEVDFLRQPVRVATTWVVPQTYVKLTSEAGSMQEVRVNMWDKINKMTSTELGGERIYIADFEVYDERANDLSNAVLDIYIGLRSKSS